MALACAGLLGYRLAWNFDFPYLSPDISQFWRRWHMSLSSWLRDYLYIPLGGNRGGRWFVARNLLLTMILGGLWHGAAWHFVFWGGLHGLALVTHREWHARVRSNGGVVVDGGRDAVDVLLGLRVLDIFPRAGFARRGGGVAAIPALARGRHAPTTGRRAVDRVSRVDRVDPREQPAACVRGRVGAVTGLGILRDIRRRGRSRAAVCAAALCAVYLFPVLNRRGRLTSSGHRIRALSGPGTGYRHPAFVGSNPQRKAWDKSTRRNPPRRRPSGSSSR